MKADIDKYVAIAYYKYELATDNAAKSFDRIVLNVRQVNIFMRRLQL